MYVFRAVSYRRVSSGRYGWVITFTESARQEARTRGQPTVGVQLISLSGSNRVSPHTRPWTRMCFAKSRKRFARGGRPAYLRARLITSAGAVTLAGVVASDGLVKPKALYHGYRFPPQRSSARWSAGISASNRAYATLRSYYSSAA